MASAMQSSASSPYLVLPDGREVPLTDFVRIGRSPDSDVCIESEFVSRAHALLEVTGEGVFLADLGSGNGTRRNGRRVTDRTLLSDGDRIEIGDQALVYRDEGRRRSASAQPGMVPVSLVAADGTEFALEAVSYVGRDESNDVVLTDDTSISKRHARIDIEAGRVLITDLGSRNGTSVSGRLIEAVTVVAHGDEISVGDTVLRLRYGGRPLPGDPARAGGPGRSRVLGMTLGGGALALALIGAVTAWVHAGLETESPGELAAAESQAPAPALAPPPVLAAPEPALPPAAGAPLPEAPDSPRAEPAPPPLAAMEPVSPPGAAPSPPPASPPAAGADTQADAEQRALRALVVVLSPVGSPSTSREVASGSGSLLTRDGHVLTNFHVVGDPDTARLYNPERWVLVGLNWLNPADTPDVFYRATVVRSDPRLDLALLRVVAQKDGGVLPADLAFPVLPVGDSDRLRLGDAIAVIGYPGLGGTTPTMTRGTASGFMADAGNRLDRGWLKTDAEINPGNSGGMAINNRGQLIGIPTRVTTGKDVEGKMGEIRPVNFARSLLLETGARLSAAE